MVDAQGKNNSEPYKITSDILLLGEGKDEVHFFRAFNKHKKIEYIDIFSIEGKDKLKEEMKALVKAPNFKKVKALGITRDADGNCKSAFQSVQEVLKNLDFPIPAKPGEFSHNESMKVGVFIFPDNNSPGILEDICLHSVEDDAKMGCVNKFLECAGFDLKNSSKNKVQAFLSVKPDKRGYIANRLGIGALSHHWNFDSPFFNDLTLFLKELIS